MLKAIKFADSCVDDGDHYTRYCVDGKLHFTRVVGRNGNEVYDYCNGFRACDGSCKQEEVEIPHVLAGILDEMIKSGRTAEQSERFFKLHQCDNAKYRECEAQCDNCTRRWEKEWK